MLKRIVIGVGSLGIACLLVFLALAWRTGIAHRSTGQGQLLRRGSITKVKCFAGAGHCAVCHTPTRGTRVGRRVGATPFGTIYSTNITPDPETGIGRWSEAAFARAMHEGVARDGSHLFPAFPYDHFTKLPTTMSRHSTLIS